MTDYDYDQIDPGYYHESMIKGKKVQQFWHKNKFNSVIEKIPKKNVRMLDVACGPGTFFYLLRKKNKKALLTGIDLAKDQIEFAKKLVPNAEFIAINATKLSRAEKFDYITMFEFIEHITKSEEKKILRNLNKLIADDGKLYITTPNYLSLWPIVELFWNKWSNVDYTHQHINKKNIFNIKKTLEQNGFRVIKRKTIFVISPYVALISPRLADFVFKIEKVILPFLGMTILIEAEKMQKHAAKKYS